MHFPIISKLIPRHDGRIQKVPGDVLGSSELFSMHRESQRSSGGLKTKNKSSNQYRQFAANYSENCSKLLSHQIQGILRI